MKRAKSKMKARSHSLVVERLECRRLLSVVPNRIRLQNHEARPDAFFQNQNQDRDQNRGRGLEVAGGRDDSRNASTSKTFNHRRTNRGPKPFGRNDHQFGGANGLHGGSRSDGGSRLDLNANTASIAIPSRPELQASNTPLAKIDAPAASLPPRLLSRPLPVVLNSRPQLRETLSAASEPTLELSSDSRSQPISIAPRFGEADANTLPIAIFEDANPSRAATQATRDAATAVKASVNNLDVAFAAAAQAFANYGGSEEDRQSPQQEAGLPNVNTFGGEVELDQMPKLVDTLPAVIDEIELTLDVHNGGEDGETLEEETNTLPLEKVQKRDVEESSSEEQGSQAEQAVEARDVSTDIIFADAEDAELFGGEVEMPETLVCTDGDDEISFDSIVPVAPRIDQIMSQAPLIEIGDNADQGGEEHEPIAINVKASLPAAVLCLPAMCLRSTGAKERKAGAQEKRNRNRLRYSL